MNGTMNPISSFPLLFRYFYSDGQQSLQDPVTCHYQSLRGQVVDGTLTRYERSENELETYTGFQVAFSQLLYRLSCNT